MALELHDGKITGSSGVAKAGLALGIVGTALAMGGNNFGFGRFTNFGNWNGCYNLETNKMSELESKIAELKSMRYSDQVGIELYQAIVSASNAADQKIRDNQKDAFSYIIELDKNVALNAQAQELNRKYDNMARDYQFAILNNKIDCCCEKAAMRDEFAKKINEMSDASIISYVNSNFLPGVLKLPLTSICPPAQPAA